MARSREEVFALIRAHEQELRQQFDVAELYVFGSVARGQETAASDVDLVVSFRGLPDLMRFLDLAEFLERVLDVEVDLIRKEAIAERLRPRVMAEMVRAA